MVAGDFIAPEDRDVYDAAKYIDTTHTSPAERPPSPARTSWGLVDVFREMIKRISSSLVEDGGPFRVRIDATEPVPGQAGAQWALIDRNARKGRRPPITPRCS